MDGDRERWNGKWRERAGELETEAPFLRKHAMHLPSRGKALDVAGGAGRNSIWLARRGLDVTLVDISDVALDKAERRAVAAGLKIKFVHHDLDTDLPFAPLFDLVLVFHYLNRTRRDDYVSLLHDGGMLIAVQPTTKNLERHAKPGREYLVEPGEMASWVRGLGMDVVVDFEDWTDDGRHEAAVIAKRASRVVEAVPPEESGPAQGPYR
jgi:tellurite methyltransferase